MTFLRIFFKSSIFSCLYFSSIYPPWKYCADNRVRSVKIKVAPLLKNVLHKVKSIGKKRKKKSKNIISFYLKIKFYIFNKTNIKCLKYLVSAILHINFPVESCLLGIDNPKLYYCFCVVSIFAHFYNSGGFSSERLGLLEIFAFEKFKNRVINDNKGWMGKVDDQFELWENILVIEMLFVYYGNKIEILKKND
uniref:Uncharacterized protein n=1 Tax=Heterorhabditis bacteriophora TaxID=37862 RepID=A0A1I7W6P3_HETBA